jgi:hypothetical protein
VDQQVGKKQEVWGDVLNKKVKGKEKCFWIRMSFVKSALS